MSMQERIQALLPTNHPPRSPGKIEVMMERARLHLELFSRGDAEMPLNVGLKRRKKTENDVRSVVRLHLGKVVEEVAAPAPAESRHRTKREISRSQTEWAKIADRQRKKRSRRLAA